MPTRVLPSASDRFFQKLPFFVYGRIIYLGSEYKGVDYQEPLVPSIFLQWSQIMPDFSQLTERQREIYEFIRERIERRGYGPTVREIGEGFGIKSPNGVMCHLKALEKK